MRKNLNTIDEIRRDYQASHAFKFLLDNNRALQQEIGEHKAYIAELEDTLKNIQPTYDSRKQFTAKVNYANLVASSEAKNKQIKALNERCRRLKIENDRYFTRIVQLEQEKLNTRNNDTTN